jgi:hypothetical protein
MGCRWLRIYPASNMRGSGVDREGQDLVSDIRISDREEEKRPNWPPRHQNGSSASSVFLTIRNLVIPKESTFVARLGGPTRMTELRHIWCMIRAPEHKQHISTYSAFQSHKPRYVSDNSVTHPKTSVLLSQDLHSPTSIRALPQSLLHQPRLQQGYCLESHSCDNRNILRFFA